MLSQTAEHALRAVIFLARQRPEQLIPADVIAEAVGAPRNYLSKTLHALAKRGILESMRGPHGGFRLGVPAVELTLAEVALVFDEPRSRGTCMAGGGPCRDDDPCELHLRWKALSEEARSPLQRTSVADLLREEPRASPAAATAAGATRPTVLRAVGNAR